MINNVTVNFVHSNSSSGIPFLLLRLSFFHTKQWLPPCWKPPLLHCREAVLHLQVHIAGSLKAAHHWRWCSANSTFSASQEPRFVLKSFSRFVAGDFYSVFILSSKVLINYCNFVIWFLSRKKTSVQSWEQAQERKENGGCSRERIAWCHGLLTWEALWFTNRQLHAAQRN
jgi:hypothetical protein